MWIWVEPDVGPEKLQTQSVHLALGCVWFDFWLLPLKAKSQPKGWIQEAAFSKSRLSRSVNLKAPLDLLLVAFQMEL
jgi:hypothetical protein